MLQALDLAERSYARDSTLVAALFNRALIRERLFLVATARRAWDEYLAVDQNSAWREEAKDRGRRLEINEPPQWTEMVTSQFGWKEGVRAADIAKRVRYAPEAAREFAFRTLFREWGLAVERKQSDRAEMVRSMMRQIAQEFEALHGDLSLSLALHSINARADHPNELNRLARAFVDVSDGINLYMRAAYDDALAPLGRAEHTFHSFASPVARWAAFYRGAASVNRGDYSTGRSIFSI
jgi:hypothetical protein